MSEELTFSSEALISFEFKDKKSYFGYKDGKWVFWGDLEINESALFWESVGKMIDSYIHNNFIMVDGKLQKKEDKN